MTEKGSISVETEHIFPIIKRWLYSDKEIFLRELISNACDAITKEARLVSLGEEKDDGIPYKITVSLNEEDSTLTVSDNGIGMSEEEVRKYINQIALSGAVDFIQKYEGDSNSGIIGHFGLGFYSAFMVSDRVDIQTKSHDEKAPAVFWTAETEGNFEMGEGSRKERGTDIILHISEEEKSYVSAAKVREILEKYCSFMPYEIYFSENGKEDEKPINDTHPLWLKNPADCTEEEYDEFYHKVFHDYKEPLFSIHINADYPLNFKGILYFPKISHEYENMEGQVKLYYNQVFVADNIKEVVPEYLLMLKGVLDCPEIPLNVSRSFLQNSGYVSKISAHIIKKIADKIADLFENHREEYESFWTDIKPFMEYGCLRDKKFFDRVEKYMLYKTTDGKYKTLEEYLEGKEKKILYYTTDPVLQSRYIALLKEEGFEVCELRSMMDSQFISFLETQKADTKFLRVDSDITDTLSNEGGVENEALSDLFKHAIGKKDMEVAFSALKNQGTPAIITLSEEGRRLADMMKYYSAMGQGAGLPDMPSGEKLVINTNNSLIKKIEGLLAEDKEKAEKLASEVYMLALISQRPLSADELEKFVTDSASLLEKL